MYVYHDAQLENVKFGRMEFTMWMKMHIAL